MFLRRAFTQGRHKSPFSRPSLIPPAYPPSLVSALSTEATALRHELKKSPDAENELPTVGAQKHIFDQVKRLHAAVVETRNPTSGAIRIFNETLEAFSILRRPFLVPQPTQTLLTDVLLSLARSSEQQDQANCEHLLQFVADFQRLQVATVLESVVTDLIHRRDFRAALDWLCLSSQLKVLRDVDTLPQWHRLLAAAAEQGDEYIIASCFKKIAQTTVGPTAETARLTITALFRGPSPTSTLNTYSPSMETMKHTIKLIASASIRFDRDVAQSIRRGYAQAGDEELGRTMECLYKTSVPPTRDLIEGITEEEMHGLLQSIPSQRHRRRFMLQAMEMGFQPSEATLVAALYDNFTYPNFAVWRRLMRLPGCQGTSANIMEQTSQRSTDPQDVLEIYRSELKCGFKPSSDMLYMTLKARLSGKLNVPSRHAIKEALELYREYLSVCSQSSRTQEDPGEHGSVTGPPDAKVYQLLLRAATSHANKYLVDVISLVEDMKRFGVQVDPELATSIIVILMRTSSHPSDALRVYRLVSSSFVSEESSLNEDNYAAILDVFCKLETWPHGIPSARNYFEIISDMRQHGVPANAKVFTIILGQLGRLATKTSGHGEKESEVRENIARTLTRVHNQLTVNPEFTPDTALWNQLMDAYQRVGCFTEAFRIWQQLFASGKFNKPSVSIIFDACAYHQAADVAVRIYRALIDIKFPMNIRNWNTFLECLCRCNKLDEALKVLCIEMKGGDVGVDPDVESVRILLKFAVGSNQEAQVRTRVKRFLPKLYHSL